MTDSIPFVSSEAIDAKLDYPSLIAALKAAFAADWTVPVRHHHAVPIPGEPDQTLLLMPAWEGGKSVGVKLVTITPGNGARNLPAVQGIYLLLDGGTGVPKVLMEGTTLTVRRTAAASALAAGFCARKDAAVHLMVGAGALARPLIEAHRAARPIQRTLLWARKPEQAEAKAADLAKAGIAVEVAHDLETAARQADIVSCATLSSEPLIHGAWLKPGAHLDLVGAYLPELRESDDEAVRRATLFCDTRGGALKEGGDLVQPLKAGVIQESSIAAELADLCKGKHPGRTRDEEITLFKSVGTAIEDLAAAKLMLERM
ncbi:ornithine cyclodeaminase family protein [Dongia sedimenti]|uniref:Ornithine cyclodeaminase family protein n=1 Tax=Dongia sedimenti TaxID=3064282 RepID=A0ABU0YLD7_9PROT|nr:ornithine cyclodeaminase family protein [Rhodospirillaceae bacterium R-7]